MTLQENSKTDKDHEVIIINFLCTTCLMKDKVTNNELGVDVGKGFYDYTNGITLRI